MDSLTHIAIGACIGEAVLHKQLGKRALLWGILAQSIPDIDFIATTWLNTSENLLAHRGFTHSILFGVLISIAMALACDHWHRPHDTRFSKFILFFTAQVFIHIGLDSLNAYGIGLFEPFTHQRFSFDVLFVADPFFSIAPGIAIIALFILRNHERRQRLLWMRIGLLVPVLYICYALYNKLTIHNDVRNILSKQNIACKDYFTTPTPFNNWLWFVVAANDSGYNIGYRSVFDRRRQIDFTFFPKNDSLLKPTKDADTERLIRFARNYYTIEKQGDTLVFNDLRFGQVAGWNDPHAPFAFHYFLDYPGNNTLVVQRGRFKGWNWQTVKSLLRRIKGN